MGRDDLLDEPRPRRFQLVRREDVSGMSGTGIVAEGIKFRDGKCAYRWLTAPGTTQIAESPHDIQHIHGHNGRTELRYLDDREHEPGEEKSLAEIYDERNLLAVAFAELAYQHVAPGFSGGWHPPTDADDADAAEWAVVWAALPAGQVSWHVPRSLVEGTDLIQASLDYDGHTPEEKNQRLVSFARGDW